MRKTLLLSCLLGGLMVIGCKRESQDITVREVPKQPALAQAQPQAMPMMAAAAPAADANTPSVESGPNEQLTWTVPSGWKQLAGDQMRVASFQVSPDHPDVVLTVIPLAIAGGQLLPNVNRWEGQLSLPPTKEADLPKIVKQIQVNGVSIDTVDLLGPASSNPRMEMLGAILPHNDKAWFFKLVGPADVVGPQREKFQEYLKSLRFTAGAGNAANAAAPNAAGGAQPQMPAGHPTLPGAAPEGQPQMPAGHPALPGAAPNDQQMPAGHPAMPGMPAAMGQQNEPAPITFKVPDGWTKDAELPLRVVSFHVGEGDKQTDIIVSALPAAGTGTYQDNVNRWRAQVNLPPLKQGEAQPSQPVVVGGADGAQFDLVGPGDKTIARHMSLAWIPRGDTWWFFKMVGPDQAVSAQQANFQSFLKSVQFAGDNNREPTTAPKP